jgi:CubicO group peptidase (beta-lactamase class C family)
MQIASVSKTVTAVALLKLREDSQNTDQAFSLDDPFWPHIEKLCPKAADDVKRVTIRQLLMHTSGFEDKAGEEMPRDLDKLLNRPLAYAPGKGSKYQNINYYLARLVLEGVGKVEYTPYVKEHVLKPMGITGMDTHFDASRLACGYAKSDKPNAAGDPWAVNFDATAGAGGWFATADEMGKFLEGVRTHTVLSEKTTKEMLKDNLGWDYSDPGWTKGGLVINGAGQIVACRASLFPDGVTAVIFVNAKSPTEEDPLGLAWLRDRGE